MRILLIEEERLVSGWLTKALGQEKYAVDCVFSAEDASHVLGTEEYSLVILALTGRTADRVDAIAQLRSLDGAVPLIVLSADDSREGRIVGLNAGADDYLIKPFDMGELKARIRVQLRRANFHREPIVRCGALALDSNSRRFTVGGEALELTRREHAVLETLIFRAGTTIRKRALAMSIFGFEDEVHPNAVEVYIHRVRKKLRSSGVGIVTRRGLGYSLKDLSGMQFRSAV